jgi:hypothetical protein
MSYCNGDCDSLNNKSHKCKKYGKGLAYIKQSGSGSIGYSAHEQCRECGNDMWIKRLENKINVVSRDLTVLLNNANDSSDYREGIIDVLHLLDWNNRP